MAIGAIFQVNFNLDFGQLDIAGAESVMHEALRAAGFPVMSIEYDETVSVGAPLQTNVFEPGQRRTVSGPLGPSGPFGRIL